jgi:hypothetical protein
VDRGPTLYGVHGNPDDFLKSYNIYIKEIIGINNLSIFFSKKKKKRKPLEFDVYSLSLNW